MVDLWDDLILFQADAFKAPFRADNEALTNDFFRGVLSAIPAYPQVHFIQFMVGNKNSECLRQGPWLIVRVLRPADEIFGHPNALTKTDRN